MKKKLYFIGINSTKKVYEDNLENTNQLLHMLKQYKTTHILNYDTCKKEINQFIKDEQYFIVKWEKSLFEQLCLEKYKLNLATKRDTDFYSMLEYFGMIENDSLLLVIFDEDLSFNEDVADKLENIMTIYSYDKIKEQSFCRSFIKNIDSKGYKIVSNFLKKISKIPKTLNRKCKYCGREDKKYFQNDSHIIPKSWKNYKYIDHNECDCCNQKFSEIIENDSTKFINLLCDNKSIVNDYTINMTNLYRLLVKITIGFLNDEDILNNLENTINWIRNTKNNDKALPYIILLKNYKAPNNNTPEVSIYKNKYKNNNPYIYSELLIGSFLITYIIPFAKEDTNKDFTDIEYFEKFKNITDTIKYSNKSNNFKYIILDCNSTNKYASQLNDEIKKL
ncbi:hypothetical protein [Brachyspira pilosicoli]